MIDYFIAYDGAAYIRDLTVHVYAVLNGVYNSYESEYCFEYIIANQFHTMYMYYHNVDEMLKECVVNA